MGYTTEFKGAFQLSRPLTLREAKIILDVHDDPDKAQGPGKPERSYMQWVPTKDLCHIVWDGEEKFYDYCEWLSWLGTMLNAGGITMSGRVRYSGEEADDTGWILIIDGVVHQEPDVQVEVENLAPLTRRELSDIALEALEA